MPDFNASQTAAIEAQNQNILVSAAAGSGKTTVMVEKIKETLIRHPEASISQFLVITFTKDAAQNMKDKLRNLLEKASQKGIEQASKALSEIETATISTIHSFCTQLLKEYNDNAGASMTPRVLKDTEKKKILNECFKDAANLVLAPSSTYSLQDRKDLNALMTAFSLEELGKMVQDLYNVLMGIPNPFEFLAQVVQEPPYQLWNREIMTSIELDILGLEESLRQESELLTMPLALPVYEDVVQNDSELVRDFLEAFRHTETAEDKKALLESTKAGFGKAPTVKGIDEATKAWKKQIVCNAHTWEFFRKNTSFSKDRIRKKDRRKGFYEVAVNGVTLHYAVIGEGKPIVLIHGNGEDHNIFSVEIDQLVAAGYRVYAPDSRGHGANEPMSEYHYADMAEDVYEFIQAMGLTKPALYGHSDGGIIGLLLEITHPGTLGALAISGTNLSPEGLIPSFIKEYTEINKERPDPLITLMLTEPQINPKALKSIRIPVLVTAGENDLILRSETEKIASTIPNSTMIIVENEDHGSYIVNSEIMGNLLIDFLRKVGYTHEEGV